MLRHMYKWAIARKLVDGNPAKDVPKVSKYKARERCLTHDEIRLFWSACDQVEWPRAAHLRLCGYRKGVEAK